jgi:hypothetical protein
VLYDSSNDGLVVLLPVEAIQLLAGNELIPDLGRPVVCIGQVTAQKAT